MAPTTSIQIIASLEEIRSCYPVMKQLRPHVTSEDAFVDQVGRQFSEGYQLVACLDQEQVKAVMGFRYLEFLAWGKVLYIDDLITHEDTRKNGCATILLNWSVEQAKQQNCDQVHLDSGPQRHNAHRLYMKQGFKIVGYHFALDLPT